MRSATKAGVAVERFWQLTPAEIMIEIDAWQTRREIEDYRTGLICAVMAELHRDPDKKPEPFTPADFVPGIKEKQRDIQTPEEQLEIIKIINAAMGGLIIEN